MTPARVILCVAILLLAGAAQAQRKPLSKDSVVKLLKGDFPPNRVAEIARKHGIDFQIVPEIESDLRQAGAADSLLATLRELAHKPAPAAGPARENPKDGLKYVWVPPGTFQMGCSPGDSECDGNEKPAHQVTLSKGFWIGQTEVTVAAYKRFAASAGRLVAQGCQVRARI